MKSMKESCRLSLIRKLNCDLSLEYFIPTVVSIIFLIQGCVHASLPQFAFCGTIKYNYKIRNTIVKSDSSKASCFPFFPETHHKRQDSVDFGLGFLVRLYLVFWFFCIVFLAKKKTKNQNPHLTCVKVLQVQICHCLLHFSQLMIQKSGF